MKPRIYNILKLSVIFLTLLGFSIPAFSEENWKFERMWPALQQPWYFSKPNGIAIDRNGYCYVADTKNYRIQKFTSDGRFVGKWGRKGSEDGEFFMPEGVAVDSKGFVYVADRWNSRIQKFTTDGTYLNKWKSHDDEDIRASGIAVDDEFVYVVNAGNHLIYKFTADGQFMDKWGNESGEELPFFFGVAMDSNGFVYVSHAENHQIQKFTRQGEPVMAWGSKGTENGEFDTPSGIAVDISGFVYVVDRKNDRIQKFTTDGEFKKTWGSKGSGERELNAPSGIAVDNRGFVYVADMQNDRIQKFTTDGDFVTGWRSRSKEKGEFYLSEDIDVGSDGSVYVLDKNNHRIQKFRSDGIFVKAWGSQGCDDGAFNFPYGLASDKKGFVYVADTLNDRIQKLDSEGNFRYKWGTEGLDTGQFDDPSDVAIDSRGFVYVVDWENNRIQKFDSEGNFVSEWGTYGSESGEFKQPFSISIDSSDCVYVTDTLHNCRIQKFDSAGGFITEWGGCGSDDGHFSDYSGIAVDNDDNIYVADSGNHRIQKFDADGQFITEFGEFGSGAGQMNMPRHLCVGQNGLVYVSDTANNRVQVFRKAGTAEKVSKAIIIAGGGPYPGDHLWDATRQCANFAYRTLNHRGFTKHDIMYLSSDTATDLDNNGAFDDVDDISTPDNLRKAITEWAAADADRRLIIYIYLVDHGGHEKFLMDAETPTFLTASKLDEWLDDLQESVPTSEVIVISDACQSGSFVPLLKSSDAKPRMIITSTSPDENAHFLNQGTISFSSFFWTNIFNDCDIGTAFEQAKGAVSSAEAFSFQTPRQDTSGDFPFETCLGNAGSLLHDVPLIEAVSAKTVGESSIVQFRASGVRDKDGIERLRAFIMPPGYGGGLSDGTIMDLPFVNLMPTEEEGEYEGTYDGCHADGTYTVVFFASDRKGNISLPRQTTVVVGNPARHRAILVLGYGPDEQKAVLENNVRSAYSALSFQGYSDEDIYLLAPTDIPGFHHLIRHPSEQDSLDYAITEWASQNTQDVLVYLTGKGGKGTFQISGTETLSGSELGDWLGELEGNISGRIIVIYDADYAGSFLSFLSPSAGKERILITGASEGQPATFLSKGYISFSAFFWKYVRCGENVRDAFLKAKDDLVAFSGHVEPQLDDTGDGIGNETDGRIAMNHTIGMGIRLVPGDPDFDLDECSDGPDHYEPDDMPEQASAIVVGGNPQRHNFYKAGDADWVRFEGIAEKPYTLAITRHGADCNPVIEVYDSDNRLLRSYESPSDSHTEKRLNWKCDQRGTYYVRISQAVPDSFGKDTCYDLQIYHPTAGLQGVLCGKIRDAVYGTPIEGALIKIVNTNGDDISNSGGGYWIMFSPGTFTISVDVRGYMSEDRSGIVIKELDAVSENFELEPCHSADYNPRDHKISLPETLRVIQLYRSDAYHCNPGQEDGYAPRPGDTDCSPHDSDYAPQDWRIGLTELLRVIAFYNASGYHPDLNGEDRFSLGKLSREAITED